MEAVAPALRSPSQNPNGFDSLAFKAFMDEETGRGSTELYRAAEAVQEVMDTEGWKAIHDVLAVAEKRLQTELFRNIGSNQAKAAQAAGHLEGLQAAQRMAHAILTVAASVRKQLAADAAREAS